MPGQKEERPVIMVQLRRQRRRLCWSLKWKSLSPTQRKGQRPWCLMVNAFEVKTSRGRTRSRPPMMKNDCVSPSFRYEALTDSSRTRTITLSADRCCPIFSPFRTTGSVPLETNAAFTMTSLNTWHPSRLTSGNAATSMICLENVLMVSAVASPKRTRHLTFKPWRTQNSLRLVRAGTRWRTAWAKTSRLVWGSVLCPSQSQRSTWKRFRTTRTKKQNSEGMVRGFKWF